MQNLWKMLFFLLFGLNILAGLTILMFMYFPTNPDDSSQRMIDLDEGREEVKFQISTNKADLNKLIKHYLESTAPKNEIDYEVILQDEVELYGILKVFTKDIRMKLTFDAEALPNGDLILKQNSMSIGQLRLPASYVLKFVNDHYSFPDWVSILPNDEIVYVALQKMKLKSDIKVKVNKFDLRNDDIMITIGVPTD